MIITGSKCQIEFCKWIVKPQQSHFLQCCMKPFIHSFSLSIAGLAYSRQTAWDFFLKNVRDNFRVVLATHLSRHSFQKSCNLFPHLTTHMNIIYFHHWKLQQLIEVANYHVPGSSPSLNQIFSLFVSTTSQVRVLHSTKSFLFSSLPRPRFESFTQLNLFSSRLYHVPGSSPSLN